MLLVVWSVNIYVICVLSMGTGSLSEYLSFKVVLMVGHFHNRDRS